MFLADSKDEVTIDLQETAMVRGVTYVKSRPQPMIYAWAAALVLYSLIVPTGVAGPRAAMVINDIAWTLAAALATISCLRAARSQPGRDRAAWLLFAAACGAWTVGQIAWSVYQLLLRVHVPLPSYADIGYLAFGPLMIAGLFALRGTQQERKMTWLRIANLGLILCSLAVVLLAMLLHPFLESVRPRQEALIVVAESALIAIAFIFAVYFLWSYRWGNRLPSAALITAGLALQMVSALFYTRELVLSEYGVSSAFNVGWLLAFACQQGAAEAQVRAQRNAERATTLSMQQRQGWVEALVPSFLLCCIAITTFALADEISELVIKLGSIVLAAFAVILALREGWLYSRGLQRQAQLARSELELSQARSQLRLLDAQRAELEQSIELTSRAGSVGLWTWDVRTNAMHYSREWKRQLGYADAEISSRIEEWSERMHPDDRQRISAELARFIENPHGEFVAEQRLLHRDGTYRWILTQGSASLDDAGRPAQMLGSHVDITALKNLELSLRDSERRYRELVDELEARVAERTSELTDAYRESQNFAYAVAHDLKAPLRAIDGFSALLLESADERLNDVERSHIERVRRGAIHMDSLIDGLLAYSRIEHQELRFGSIDCRDFVEDLIETSIDVRSGNVAIFNSVERTPICADREGLRIVLRNLLDNAVKFSRGSPAPRIEIGSTTEAGSMVLSVRDNGIGFDPKYHDKIFEIFNRLHASGYEGTGIGLALVRKAVQRMRGRIWAEATPGRGATFFVSLPLAGGELDDGVAGSEAGRTAPPV